MKLQCLVCKETIEDNKEHEAVSCKCKNCYLIKGKFYANFGGKILNKILVIFNDGVEINASEEEKCKQKYEEWEENNARNLLIKEV